MVSKKDCGFLILIVFLFSCTTPEIVENKALEKQLLGEWRSSSLKLTMNTFNNKDTTRVFEVNENNWEKKMNIRPIKTIYFGDGTYYTEHRNLHDSLIYDPAGSWKILGDTIILRDTIPNKGLPYKYKIVINNDHVEFTGIEDCDNDGKADDNYYGVQRKIKRR